VRSEGGLYIRDGATDVPISEGVGRESNETRRCILRDIGMGGLLRPEELPELSRRLEEDLPETKDLRGF